MSALFDRINLRCNELGITPTYMCNNAGIRKSLVTDLKTGRLDGVNSTTLLAIANFLRVSCDWLLTGEDKADLSDEEQALIHAYRLSSFDEKENVAFILRKYGAVAPKEISVKQDAV